MSKTAALQTPVTRADLSATSLTPVQNRLLQRKCAYGSTSGWTSECAREKQEPKELNRAIDHCSEAPSIVHEVLRSPGQPLDRATRALMELRLHHDFGRVRVHTDSRAAESTRAVNAIAYTVGRDVVFRREAYNTRTDWGRDLLAHELVHTIQQEGSQSTPGEMLTIGEADTASEIEAEKTVSRFNQGDASQSSGMSKVAIPCLQRWDFGGLGIALARQAEEERIQQGCPVKSEGTLSEVSWGETSGFYPSAENKYDPGKWDPVKKCELLRARGAIHAVGQRGEKVNRGRPGNDPILQKLKPYHFIENFLSLEPEIGKPEVKWFYLSKHATLTTHPTMSSLVWVKKYGPFFNVGGGDVPKGDAYIHFYRKGA